MYAIVDFMGYQYRVEKDAKLKVPYMDANEIGSLIEMPRILMIHDDNNKIILGKPTVENAIVKAEILSHGKERKIVVFKKKRRKGYNKTMGHRQRFTEIVIKEITN